MRTLVALLFFSTLLQAQAAIVKNLGGSCGFAGSITRIDRPIIGKKWELHSVWIEPLGASAWILLGDKDPKTPVGKCTLHTNATIVIPVLWAGGSRDLSLRIPNNKALVGTKVYAQGVFTATNRGWSASNGWELTVGSR